MSKTISLHGCIRINVPDRMSEYEVMKRLETLLDGGNKGPGAKLGGAAYIDDYFVGRIGEGTYVDQKTSNYEEWLKEVTSEDRR